MVFTQNTKLLVLEMGLPNGTAEKAYNLEFTKWNPDDAIVIHGRGLKRAKLGGILGGIFSLSCQTQ